MKEKSVISRSCPPSLLRVREKGISRIDSGGTHGWFVRVYENSTTHSKLFSDGKHGGAEAALALARRHRDLLTVELAWRRPAVQPGFTARSNTGVLGVTKTKKKNRNGGVSHCYNVSWSENGTHRCKTFSIERLGEKEAFRQACLFRKEKEQLMQVGRAEKQQERRREITERLGVQGRAGGK